MPREERLENLRELILPTFPMGYSGDIIGRIIEHCPGLESWNIPNANNDDAAKPLYRTIAETVQRQHRQGQESRYLGHLAAELYTENCRGEGWMDIMNALPEQRVESVTLDWHMDAFPNKFVPALLRHSEVLRSVIFKNSQMVESRTVATILGQCRGLETFWAIKRRQYYGVKGVALEIDHATEQEWACERIKSLRCTVDLAVLEQFGKVSQPPKEYWQKLRSFYTQLGKLTELKELEIFIAPSLYPLRLLNGLSLEEEDKETGRQGFLSLLGGLKKLRVLHGSFWSGTEEPIATFGQLEAEWIVCHWPALETIDLLPEEYMKLAGFRIPKHLEWLHETKPELKFFR